MMDVAKSELLRNFTILIKALLFFLKIARNKKTCNCSLKKEERPRESNLQSFLNQYSTVPIIIMNLRNMMENAAMMLTVSII